MPDLNQAVLHYAQSKIDDRVERGECWDLAEKALKSAGGSRPDPSKLYVWSNTVVSIQNNRPGDIVQFKTFRSDINKEYDDGSTWTGYDTMGGPHHTAIVKENHGNGKITIIEQNRPVGSATTENTVFLKTTQFRDRENGQGVKIKIETTGRVRFYRPKN